MFTFIKTTVLSLFLGTFAAVLVAQTEYQVIHVNESGNITGTVRWSGPMPHIASFPITKDPQICDPDSHKKEDLERLIIGPQGGVVNTVVYLKDITRGKAMEVPETRRFLDQKHCRYEPHILLVPQNDVLEMKSSDPVLHTVHMDGAATFNLPFPFENRVIKRNMSSPGLVNLRCNGGHVWMNAEMFVIPHPYYAVTDESGRFELTGVPPGTYEIEAWHEGWGVIRQEQSFDVLTERKVDRPIFTEPKTWDKKVSVTANQTSTVNFTIAEK